MVIALHAQPTTTRHAVHGTHSLASVQHTCAVQPACQTNRRDTDWFRNKVKTRASPPNCVWETRVGSKAGSRHAPQPLKGKPLKGSLHPHSTHTHFNSVQLQPNAPAPPLSLQPVARSGPVLHSCHARLLSHISISQSHPQPQPHTLRKMRGRAGGRCPRGMCYPAGHHAYCTTQAGVGPTVVQLGGSLVPATDPSTHHIHTACACTSQLIPAHTTYTLHVHAHLSRYSMDTLGSCTGCNCSVISRSALAGCHVATTGQLYSESRRLLHHGYDYIALRTQCRTTAVRAHCAYLVDSTPTTTLMHDKNRYETHTQQT
jgi:hypothetical protein